MKSKMMETRELFDKYLEASQRVIAEKKLEQTISDCRRTEIMDDLTSCSNDKFS